MSWLLLYISEKRRNVAHVVERFVDWSGIRIGQALEGIWGLTPPTYSEASRKENVKRIVVPVRFWGNRAGLGARSPGMKNWKAKTNPFCDQPHRTSVSLKKS
jgi:hypothetical protein